MVAPAVPPKAHKAAMPARMFPPSNPCPNAIAAHCAGRRTNSQSGIAPGEAAAVARSAPSPATTASPIHHPLSDALRANRAPRAAKLTLATKIAAPIQIISDNERAWVNAANATRSAPERTPNPRPVENLRLTAAEIIPAAIMPTATIGTLGALGAKSRTRAGASRPRPRATSHPDMESAGNLYLASLAMPTQWTTHSFGASGRFSSLSPQGNAENTAVPWRIS